MTTEEAATVIRHLVAAWPYPAWSDDTVDAYCAGIADLDADAALRAAQELIRESLGRPAIAGFRRHIQRYQPERVELEAPVQIRRTYSAGLSEIRHPGGALETTSRERGQLEASYARRRQEAREARKAPFPLRIGEGFRRVSLTLGDWKADAKRLWSTAIERARSGPRLFGTFCDWCRADFRDVEELGPYLDWLAEARPEIGRPGADRPFCASCAPRALRAMG